MSTADHPVEPNRKVHHASTHAAKQPIERRQVPGAKKPTDWVEPFHQIADQMIGSGRAYTFRRRRIVALGLVGLSLAITAIFVSAIDAALLHRGVMTGWTLMGCLLLLLAIGVRRRIPGLPLGTMSTWTQVHIYSGVFTIGIFVMHTPMIMRGEVIASGYFEGSLSILFWLVSGSGVYGLIASRRLPARLSRVGEQIRFDQIETRRQQIAQHATSVVNHLRTASAVDVLGEFHDHYLSRYFQRRPSIWYLMIPTSVRRRRMLAGLVELKRYLDDEGKTASGHLAGLVRGRDDLDYQYALQLRLRVWVLAHATGSIALIVMAIIHGILATRFVGT